MVVAASKGNTLLLGNGAAFTLHSQESFMARPTLADGQVNGILTEPGTCPPSFPSRPFDLIPFILFISNLLVGISAFLVDASPLNVFAGASLLGYYPAMFARVRNRLKRLGLRERVLQCL